MEAKEEVDSTKRSGSNSAKEKQHPGHIEVKEENQGRDVRSSRNFLGSEGGAAGYEGGTKRQRSLDGGPFFGGSPATLQPNLMYGGSFSSPFLGHARAFPVVRLRGLPFNCTEADVFEFFAGLDVVDVLLVHKQERFSGEAFCVFGAPMQVEFALQKNRQNMGRRYIEVFRSKKQEYYQAVANEVSEPKTNVPSSFPPVRSRSHDASKDNVEHTGVLKLRGLPFSASKRDILEFFKEFDLTDDNVHIVVHSDGRATGEAYVEFSSPNDSKSAMNKDKMTLGSRYVELFPSSQEEAARAAAKR